LQRDPTAPMVFYGETDRPLVFPARSDRPGDLRQVSTISLLNYFCFDKLTVDPPISLREGVRRKIEATLNCSHKTCFHVFCEQ